MVGESGSGKSVTSLSLMRLVEFGGGQITGGKMLLSRDEKQTVNLSEVDAGTMRSIRGNEIGMIFQEPMTSLNPVVCKAVPIGIIAASITIIGQSMSL